MGRKRSRTRGRRHPGGTRPKQKALVEGTIRVIRPGIAEVSCAEGTFPVVRGGIHEAMDGDTVLVSLSHPHEGARLCRVRNVVERAAKSFVGTYHEEGSFAAVVPLDRRITHDFFVLPEDASAKRLKVRDLDVVEARITGFPTRQSAGVVTLERRIGPSADLDLNVETQIASFGLRTEFSAAAREQAESERLDVDDVLAREPYRRDLRDEVVLTVDPADARDFDDAVSARRIESGYEVGVHIADVSHYVRWGSPLDLEARQRTCSAYLADRVIPMLPEKLSNDLCSLRPDEPRLTMSVRMRLDKRGRITHAEAFRAVIQSKARLDYGTVDRLLEGAIDAASLPCGADVAPAVSEALAVLDEIRALRERVRADRGAVDFETREARVTLDDEGHPTGVEVRERTRATGLIEEAMLMANESVARMLADAEVPAAYRVHERPAPDDLKATLPVLRELGLVDNALADELVAGEPEALRTVLARAKGTSSEYLVNAILLRAQKRAIYLPHNDGHYALGARAYCHFTSPIRRYPDLIVHRALKALLDHSIEGREQRSIQRQLPQLCRACSDGERAADGAARATQAVKMAELYAGRVGESYSGVVSGCERYGLFVELDDDCAEGLIPTRALGDERFTLDERRHCLIGESTGRVWRLGQRIAVEVVGATPERGQIDFGLAGRGSIQAHDSKKKE